MHNDNDRPKLTNSRVRLLHPMPDRRLFLKTAALGTAALAAHAAPRIADSSETLVATQQATPEQKNVICFPFGHELQSKVDNNWHITPTKIAQFFTPDQQAMVEEIFKGLHNPEFVDKVMMHMKEDDKGFGNYSVALFGEPGTGKFEFVLTGVTVRLAATETRWKAPLSAGRSSTVIRPVPILRERPDHPGNVYWFQAKRANEVFAALDGKQRNLALLGDPRKGREDSHDRVAPQRQAGWSAGFGNEQGPAQTGRACSGRSAAAFRKKDVDDAMRCIKANGGINAVSMAFYQNLDLGVDKVWDVWQLESPQMVWYFRGHPHVHTWVNIKA